MQQKFPEASSGANIADQLFNMLFLLYLILIPLLLIRDEADVSGTQLVCAFVDNN